MNKKQVLKALEKYQTQLAKTRDNLRELRDTVEEQYENAGTAHDALMECIDTLSEYV